MDLMMRMNVGDAVRAISVIAACPLEITPTGMRATNYHSVEVDQPSIPDFSPSKSSMKSYSKPPSNGLATATLSPIARRSPRNDFLDERAETKVQSTSSS